MTIFTTYFFFILPLRRPLRSTLFPYTTLFRSVQQFPVRRSQGADPRGDRRGGTAHRGRGSVECRYHDGLGLDRKSTRLNSSHTVISYAVFCLKKKKKQKSIKFSYFSCDHDTLC